MIKRTIKQYTPNYKTLDTPIEQARAIQDLYDQVRIFYDYLNNPNFDKTHTGPMGPEGKQGEKGEQGDKGDKGDRGKSSFEVWKEIPGNENKTIEDYFNEIKTDPKAYHGSSKVIEITENVIVEETVDLGTQLDIIYLNVTEQEKTVTVIFSDTYKTPDGLNMELLVPPGGYGEINILNIDGIMFVRGS
jgi:hypothetical protein